MANQPVDTQALESLKESLRRCSPETIDAAIAYRSNRDPQLAPVIVKGIIERFLEPENRPLLQNGGDDLKLFDDLGVDSLTMMEIVILVEETLGVSVDNEDLRDLATINDINAYIAEKLGGGNT